MERLPVSSTGRAFEPASTRSARPGDPARKNGPSVCGGVAVQAGDALVGDRDGVVVIPRGDLETVIGRLDEIRRARGVRIFWRALRLRP